MKHLLYALFVLPCAALAQQHTVTVSEMNLAGPFAVQAPVAADTVGANGKRLDADAALLTSLSLKSVPTATFTGKQLPSLTDKRSVGVLSFYVNNTSYLKGSISVKGPHHSKVYVDGKESTSLDLAPEHHTVSIRFLAEPNDTDTISVTLNTQQPVTPTTDRRHPYMVHDLTDGRRVRSIALSPTGQYVVVGYQDTGRDGHSTWSYELRQTKGGQLMTTLGRDAHWLPRTDRYIVEERSEGRRQLYAVSPLTGERQLLVSGIPDGSYTVSPTEDYLIISTEEEGPKEDRDVFQVLEMDDRQPDWRKRHHLSRVDFATGLTQPLTAGVYGEQLLDISADGSRLLVMSNHSRLERRPTTVSDLYTIDVRTLACDTLLHGAEFIDGGWFSPDATQLLLRGTPEAFGRIGCQLPTNVTPSMTENELFIYDIATRQAKPLTRDFDPSVEHVEWSMADGQVYFTAEDRDYIRLFTLNPTTGKIMQMAVKGDYIYRFSIASHARKVAWLAYQTMEPASATVADLKPSGKTSAAITLFDGATALGDAVVGTCRDWDFTNSKGDTVYGRLYLPHDFDQTKTYPLIVYYYGGCAPVSRYFESPYAPQYWNSLGYVAYIIEPRGATGFGQEWASRHVNTAGGIPAADGTVPGGTPAGDIIEGTKKLCQEHPFIDSKHIGCMGASYGGFMTQYLQTVTDIFAAAVSHAGITNHTSYWGEGYWGYNYSEVSMANSYPWSHRQLYVDQSPLFNADKIHTPLLLLHGNADTNVPLIESLQMFTALKLLGRDVALVEVTGENHHILDYTKRTRWMQTQMAWFQKWLKGDSTWWDALYPKKHL